MLVRGRLPVVAVSVLLGGLWGGCFSPLELVNPAFVSAVGVGRQVATLPEEAPGLLVYVQNQTNRRVEVLISYRGAGDNVESYTQTLDPASKSGQMLTCPIQEITLGNLANLKESGARVSLTDPSVALPSVTAGPFVEVEPFGVPLREGVNYSCGDSILFVVRPSDVSRSGFETIAFFRRVAASQP